MKKYVTTGETMFEKEVNLQKAVELAYNNDYDELYNPLVYFLSEDNSNPTGWIDNNIHKKHVIPYIKKELSLSDSTDTILGLCEGILKKGGGIFCLFLNLCNWQEYQPCHDEYFFCGDDFEDVLTLEEEHLRYPSGGFGVYIKEIDGKYYCENGVYIFENKFNPNEVNGSFKYLKVSENDYIGSEAEFRLENLDIYNE